MKNLRYKPIRINIDNILIDSYDINNDSFPERNINQIACIIYTSGTTGSPKGVMITLDNLIANIEGVTKDVEIYTPEEKILILLPLHHIFPLAGTVILPLSIQATIVFAPSMSTEDILATLLSGKITMIIGVPRLYNLFRKAIKDKINKNVLTKSLFKLCEYINSLPFSRIIFMSVQKKFGGHIKYMVSGGAALDKDVCRDFRTLGFEILDGFGMTEAAPMITFTRPGKGILGSTGQPLPANTIKIVDGEITAKGRNIMKGYYNRPAETAAILKNGWLYTGDLGYLDDENRLFVTGRKKEIIVLSNGKNINPEEIEIKIAAMSEVISEIGIYEKSDMLHALVYPNFQKTKELSINNLNEMLKWDVFDKYNQSSIPYKRVMRFTVVPESLPRTRLGKLRRFMLPEMDKNITGKKRNSSKINFHEFQIIRDFLKEQKEIDICPDDHLEIDLALDSLDKVNLQVFLESSFGLKFTESDLLSFPSVIKLAEYVRDKKTRIAEELVDWGKILKEKLEMKLPKSWFTHSIIKFIAKFFLRFFFRLKGQGTENLPEGPFILAPNHQSFIDGLFIAVFLKNKLLKKTYFYAKEKHVKKGWLRFLADRHNIIVMDIDDLRTSLQKMATVLRKGKNLIIFPEGTRTKTGEIGKFKKTFAILSRELNIPIVPVMIKGAFDALPSGKKFPRLWKRINVNFMKPVYPEDKSYDDLSKTVFNMIAQSLVNK